MQVKGSVLKESSFDRFETLVSGNDCDCGVLSLGSIRIVEDKREVSQRVGFGLLAELLSGFCDLSKNELSRAFIEKEIRSSTYIGDNIALPNVVADCNLDSCKIGVLLFTNGVDYSMHDNCKVNVMVGLLTSSKSAYSKIRYLSKLTRMFKNKQFQDLLKASKTNKMVFELFSKNGFN